MSSRKDIETLQTLELNFDKFVQQILQFNISQVLITRSYAVNTMYMYM